MRIEHLLREPEFVRYLATQDYSNPVVIRPTTGEDSYLSMQVAPYGDGQLLLLVSDVSRQMRLEAVRRDFVANASHELRSPLTVISGYLETLGQDTALEADLQGPITEMRRQAERMTAIIRDLLALSRLEESDQADSGEPIDIAALLGLLRKDVLARPVHPREVRVRIDSEAQLIGDEPEIHSAFSNIVDNAAKYTSSEGSIEMRWWQDEEGGHFAVSDTGMGIPPEHIPRLTEHVLQRHGGTLEVQSTLGVGSTFTCNFPAERVAPQGQAAHAAMA
jgi:two-component system phosphate regulon sensor histidine kinase PhoR